MASANVSVNFQCEDAADAQAKVDVWKLHEGCTVFVSVSEQLAPAQTDAKGKVKEVPPPEAPAAAETNGSPTEV